MTVPIATDERRKARLEKLVRDHHAFVWRSARRLGVRPADLDDVVQEVFLMASRNLDAIEQERGYLFRTCVFVCAHARRTLQRRREVVDDERLGAEIDAGATPEESLETNQARARLQAVLDAMPKDLNTVFVLFELERFTMAEIADTLNLPPGTVASRLRRARETFMQLANETDRTGEGR
jgi:RNA polymerase sigma-70 factor (ECF subfamily)